MNQRKKKRRDACIYCVRFIALFFKPNKVFFKKKKRDKHTRNCSREYKFHSARVPAGICRWVLRVAGPLLIAVFTGDSARVPAGGCVFSASPGKVNALLVRCALAQRNHKCHRINHPPRKYRVTRYENHRAKARWTDGDCCSRDLQTLLATLVVISLMCVWVCVRQANIVSLGVFSLANKLGIYDVQKKVTQRGR